MARLNIAFNAEEVAPRQAFEVLPAGWYNAQITETEEVASNGDYDYTYYKFTFEVMDGPAKGRKVWQNIMPEYQGPNEDKAETTRRIARETLSAICHATGVIQLEDTDQLCDIPLQIKLKIRPAQGNYEASNDVTGHKPYEGPAAETGPSAGGARPSGARPAASRPTPTPTRTSNTGSANAAQAARTGVTGAAARAGATGSTRPAAAKSAPVTGRPGGKPKPAPAPSPAADAEAGEGEGPWDENETEG